ncbi:MAG: phosphoribosyl-AMP cyclohydrolase [Pseudomonadota bacterium]
MSNQNDKLFDQIKWNEQGLIPVIAQEAESGVVLMVAWMNREALSETMESGHAVYWSRSRQKLWRKGEQSNNTQQIVEIRIDCDSDVVLLVVVQHGGVACHTGRHSCFYRMYNDGEWITTSEVIKDPDEMYGPKS